MVVSLLSSLLFEWCRWAGGPNSGERPHETASDKIPGTEMLKKKTFQVRHLAAPAAQSHHISHTIGAFAPTAHPGRFVTSPHLNLTSFTPHSPYSLTFTLTPNSGAHGGDVRLRSQSGHGRATATMFPASEWPTCNVHLCQCVCRYSVRSRYVYDRDRVYVDMVIR